MAERLLLPPPSNPFCRPSAGIINMKRGFYSRNDKMIETAPELMTDDRLTSVEIPKELSECLEMLTASLIQHQILIQNIREYISENNK